MLLTVASYCMLLVIIVLLLRETFSLAPVFILVPTVTALLCGFSMSEISMYALSGIQSVLNTALLFIFSIVYFSILKEIGIFELLVRVIIKKMGNHVEILMVLTTVMAMLVQMDGSGMMTVLITIPAMLPLFDAMKIRRVTLVFLVSVASGIMNLLPWTSAMLRISASSGVEASELWINMIPLQIAGIILVIFLTVILAGIEKKNGAGMSDAEFLKVKKNLEKPVEWKRSKAVIVFDIALTFMLIGALLTGAVSSSMKFILGLSVLLIVNFRTVKEQGEQIKKHGATAYPLVLIILSIGVMIGIMKECGMVDAIAASLVKLIPDSAAQWIPVIYGVIGVPLTVVLGSDCCYSILVPVLGSICSQYGVAVMQICVVVVLSSSLAANITLIGPAPYLSIGLAGITMQENLKYSLKYLWGICVILTALAVLFGILNI